jgi:hypothetical protein
LTEHLRSHLALGRELLAVVERENTLLRSQQPIDVPQLGQERQQLLPRFQQSAERLRQLGVAWRALPPAERRRHEIVTDLLRQNQDLALRVLQLERENQQALLRRGVVS